ncbi:hypothetical protein GCM10025866_31680 [Naasia aerilata]|uniref:Uncharacterized protein n=1 Tax=Naasia aerilata TaxID=1162966 RepID=A0ABM8GFZ1_9MICO|nr:hypothetical protein GCM10025866_31680 [Naasia aerilata]
MRRVGRHHVGVPVQDEGGTLRIRALDASDDGDPAGLRLEEPRLDTEPRQPRLQVFRRLALPSERPPPQLTVFIRMRSRATVATSVRGSSDALVMPSTLPGRAVGGARAARAPGPVVIVSLLGDQ